MFDYTGKKIVTIDAYKKINPKGMIKNKEAYFVAVTMDRKNENLQDTTLWICG